MASDYLAILAREMRESADLSQGELAERIGAQQSVIARLEDAEYDGHSLKTIEKVAVACGAR
jgi:ribosome-binding protein aMBF1 (putative translation factor)